MTFLLIFLAGCCLVLVVGVCCLLVVVDYERNVALIGANYQVINIINIWQKCDFVYFVICCWLAGFVS